MASITIRNLTDEDNHIWRNDAPVTASNSYFGVPERPRSIAIQGPISSYCESVPFHTSVLEWDIGELPHGGDEAEREGRYAEIYRELAVQVRDLAETLSGGDS